MCWECGASLFLRFHSRAPVERQVYAEQYSRTMINGRHFSINTSTKSCQKNQKKWLTTKSAKPRSATQSVGHEICKTTNNICDGLKKKIIKRNDSIAKEFLSSMNKTVDPCDDFYEFVCGAWTSENVIPPSLPSWSRTAMFQEVVNHRIKGQWIQIIPRSQCTAKKKILQLNYNLGTIKNDNPYEIISTFRYFAKRTRSQWHSTSETSQKMVPILYGHR